MVPFDSLCCSMKASTLGSGPWFASLGSFSVRVFLTAAVLAASTLLSSSTTMPSKSDKEVLVTEKDDGKTIVLTRDSILVVKLESQLGTGYVWDIEGIDASRLKLLGKPTLEMPEKQAPGAREFQIFKFEPKEPGALVLKLRYVRPWEKPLKPTKTFTLKITVKA